MSIMGLQGILEGSGGRVIKMPFTFVADFIDYGTNLTDEAVMT